MKNKIVLTLSTLFLFLLSNAQIRIVNSTTNNIANGSSAFIDASSNTVINGSSNVGKGLLYPRTNLTTFTSFGGAPIGAPTSYPTRYDGLVVYNTATSGVAGVGATEGTLTPGFWYYDNKSGTTNGGTWKQLGAPASPVKTRTISGVALSSASADLPLGTTVIAANEVQRFIQASVYTGTAPNLVLVAQATTQYNKATNVVSVGNGIMYQVLPAATYTVVVEYE